MNKKRRIVVALGGNALGDTPNEQKEAVKITAKSIVDLVEKGNEVIVGHGNGPQVGMISSAFEEATKVNKKIPSMPLALSGAMSQGYIGLHLEQAIKNEFLKRNLKKDVITIVTQSIIDENDPSLKNPTKPIGSFFKEDEAKKLAKENDWFVGEDAGRGWRRMVPSPKPIDIVEKNVIKSLVEQGVIVIAGGGGGIPTLLKNKTLVEIDAVIDKDFTSEKMAELLEADLFMIVTAVDGIWKDYGKNTAKFISEISPKELDDLVAAKEFPSGSMEPKVIAVSKFVKSKKGRKAIITSLEKASDALIGKAGTKII
ncbi:MAG: carbamate kinase [Candidatus Hepatoplasma vulgare]|nr:MAG: carbamate kinase [Candidatus Hepatoplasma sp.]